MLFVYHKNWFFIIVIFLQKVRNFIVKEIQTLVNRQPRTLKEFRNMVNLLLSRVIMFNAKRGGEASRMTISNYNNPANTDARDEFGLSAFEKKLCDRYVVLLN